jgi:Ca2+/Na+ antiporter
MSATPTPRPAQLAPNNPWDAVVLYFARAKNWEVFGIVVGGYVVGLGFFFKGTAPREFSHLAQSTALAFALIGGVLSSLFLSWLLCLGKFLTSVLLPEQRMNFPFFRLAMTYAIGFVVFFMTMVTRSQFQMSLFVMSLLYMFCALYGLHFVSKSLVLAETGKAESFYDYAGPFFLLWFFFLGIWIIQPRVNRLYSASTGELNQP